MSEYGRKSMITGEKNNDFQKLTGRLKQPSLGIPGD
jgi:hypothetical protein